MLEQGLAEDEAVALMSRFVEDAAAVRWPGTALGSNPATTTLELRRGGARRSSGVSDSA
jgi:hypothetical protein